MGRGDSPLAGRLVFATGCRRSGTNWLQRILTSHPDVAGMRSETYLFNGALSKVAERFQHSNPGSPKTGKIFMPRDAMLDGLREFADRVFEENLARLSPDARFLVERTPWHVYDLELIGEVYPDARAIHIVRDGRDVARSLMSQDWGPDSMEEAAEEWRSSVTAGRRAAELLGRRYLEVRYEELLESTEAGISALFEWLGLGWDADIAERSLVEALSEFNVDPKAPRIAAGKWKKDLSATDIAIFDRIAGDLLEELGYEPGGAPLATPRESLRRVKSKAAAVRRLATKPAHRGEPRRLSEGAESDYVLFEEFLDRVTTSDSDGASQMLAPQVRVKIVTGSRSLEARASDGVRVLAEHLADWRALEPRVLSGNVHPGLNTSTAVATYALLDGRAMVRTLAATAAEGKVTSVSLFEFELAPAALILGAETAPLPAAS